MQTTVIGPFRTRPRAVSTGAAALLVAALVFGAVARADEPERRPGPRISWLGYREGKAAARHRDLPLLIYFAAAGNSGSARLEREVWTDPRVCARLDSAVVAVRVDIQEMPGVAEHFGVGEAPVVMVASPKGKPLVMVRGFHGSATILRLADYAGSGAWEFSNYEMWLSRQPRR